MFQKIIDFFICLIVFSLPLYLFRFRFFWIPLNALEGLVCLVVALWLWAVWRSGNKIKFDQNWFYPIFLVFVGATISTLFSSDPIASAGIWKSWFLTPLLFLIVLANTQKSKQQIRNIILCLFASGTMTVLVSLFYYFGGRLTYDGRLSAFFASPNYLAMFLSPILILSVALFFESRQVLSRQLRLAIQGLMMGLWFLWLVVIYLTRSHGAWLGLLVGLIAALFFLLKNKKLRWGVLFVGLFLVVAGTGLAIREPSFRSRLVVWSVALRIIKDNVWLGVGPGMFQRYYLAYQKYFEPYPEWAVPQPHNIFLAFWLETGIVGLVGFLWLLAVFFKRVQTNKPLQAVLTSTLLYILVHGLVDTTYWKNDLAFLFWLVIGISCIASHRNW